MDSSRGVYILHLEDNQSDAFLVRQALDQQNFRCQIDVVSSRSEYIDALAKGGYDLILADNVIPSLDGNAALDLAKSTLGKVPFVIVSGRKAGEVIAAQLKAAGVDGFVAKDKLCELGPLIEKTVSLRTVKIAEDEKFYVRAMERLIAVVQELSLVRDLPSVQIIVRQAAREITGAQGATFVLKDGGNCYYADEDAIAPLWKGMRFPLESCISGWVMHNRTHAVIEDIYSDARIPHSAYRPTFVKSLVMVPIRTIDPIGAIGCYWAERHSPTSEQVRLLQSLADSTALAMENIKAYSELEGKVQDRTAELRAANKELESFSYAVSHDLRAPLRHVDAYVSLLQKEVSGTLTPKSEKYLDRIREAASRMGDLIESLLELGRVSQAPMVRELCSITTMCAEYIEGLRSGASDRQVEVLIADNLTAMADHTLVQAVIANLLENAWKFTSLKEGARIEVGKTITPEGNLAFFVRDNGAGFDMTYANKLFGVFQRFHPADEFPGTGVGLANVNRIVQKHGGKIWAESQPGNGATFFFTLQ